MGRRMALGACLVLPQLCLRPFPRLRINKRWHGDGNPLARWSPRPALRITWATVVAPAPPIRLVRLPCLGTVVIGFPVRSKYWNALFSRSLQHTPCPLLSLNFTPVLADTDTQARCHGSGKGRDELAKPPGISFRAGQGPPPASQCVPGSRESPSPSADPGPRAAHRE